MPPIAWMPRRWHVSIASFEYDRIMWVVIVTSARSGIVNASLPRNFLMIEKM